MSGFDVGEILALSMSPFEVVLRGTLVYWFLFLLLRFVLRRDASSVGITDMLFIVLLGDASQNAMIGDGVLLITTLGVWNFALDYGSFHSSFLRKLLQPARIALYKDGKKNRRNMRRELLTDEEIGTELRLQGLADLSQVEAIYLEPGGEISVVKKQRG
jgi:uncharacterized membrane protein YcaP (DUF421 family)